MVESLSYTYSSRSEIERLMSTLSVEEYASEAALGDDEDANIADVIAQATDEVNYYCLKFYTEELMSENSYIRRLATDIAAYYLSQRRGEPERYVGLYNGAIDKLKEVNAGTHQIPRLPWRSDFAPCHSNIVLDYRFGKRIARVEEQTSSGEGYSGQNVDISFNPLEPY